MISALILLSIFFSGSISLAEVRCYAKRYVSIAESEAHYNRCRREQTFGLDDVIAGINSIFDDGEGEPEIIDPDLLIEARSEARAEALDCDEDDANAVKALFSSCKVPSKFVKVGNRNKYRCTVVRGSLYMYILTSGSPERFSRVAVIGINGERKAEVKYNCAK